MFFMRRNPRALPAIQNTLHEPRDLGRGGTRSDRYWCKRLCCELLDANLKQCHPLAQVVVQFSSNAAPVFFVCGDQPSRHITDHDFCCLVFGNVLNCTVQLHDTSLGITLRLTPGKEPSLRAICANHFKIECVGCPRAQRFFYGTTQPVPTFGCVELWVLPISGSGQTEIYLATVGGTNCVSRSSLHSLLNSSSV